MEVWFVVTISIRVSHWDGKAGLNSGQLTVLRHPTKERVVANTKTSHSGTSPAIRKVGQWLAKLGQKKGGGWVNTQTARTGFAYISRWQLDSGNTQRDCFPKEAHCKWRPQKRQSERGEERGSSPSLAQAVQIVCFHTTPGIHPGQTSSVVWSVLGIDWKAEKRKEREKRIPLKGKSGNPSPFWQTSPGALDSHQGMTSVDIISSTRNTRVSLLREIPKKYVENPGRVLSQEGPI